MLGRFGGPEVLELRETDDPEAAPGWVVVELEASALNWHDVLVRRGQYGSPLPHILGADGAGRRRDTGEEVMVLPSLWWGERPEAPGPSWEILGDTQRGTHAELVRVPSGCVAPKPSHLSWAEAAALPLTGLTAYRALFTRGGLQANEWALLLGAGSGVTTVATSLAVAAGANVVVTSSSDEKIARACELGAVGGVRYTEAGWADAAVDLTPGRRGFDLVLDSVGATWQHSIAAARPGGRIVVLGATGGDQAALEVRPFYFGQYSLLGTTMGSPADFAALLAFLEANHSVRPTIDRAFRLDEAADAHRQLERREHFGKLVLAHR
jgi:zinc-binding alcohol dehydrogenase/oxidoreductase